MCAVQHLDEPFNFSSVCQFGKIAGRKIIIILDVILFLKDDAAKM